MKIENERPCMQRAKNHVVIRHVAAFFILTILEANYTCIIFHDTNLLSVSLECGGGLTTFL